VAVLSDFAALLPGQPLLEGYCARRRGGRDDKKETRARADVGFTLNRQKSRATVVLVDCKYVATTKDSSKPAKVAGEAAAAAERAKVQYYDRTFMERAGGPKVVVKGFGQETEGPLGPFAREVLRQCAEAQPAYGLPGQCPVGLRYRNIIERFSVLGQICGAEAFHYYINTLGPGARHANVDNVPLEEEEDGADEGGDED
jgi:hypothetical protein